jgi:hypothetical protein
MPVSVECSLDEVLDGLRLAIISLFSFVVCGKTLLYFEKTVGEESDT